MSELIRNNAYGAVLETPPSPPPPPPPRTPTPPPPPPPPSSPCAYGDNERLNNQLFERIYHNQQSEQPPPFELEPDDLMCREQSEDRVLTQSLHITNPAAGGTIINLMKQSNAHANWSAAVSLCYIQQRNHFK